MATLVISGHLRSQSLALRPRTTANLCHLSGAKSLGQRTAGCESKLRAQWWLRATGLSGHHAPTLLRKDYFITKFGYPSFRKNQQHCTNAMPKYPKYPKYPLPSHVRLKFLKSLMTFDCELWWVLRCFLFQSKLHGLLSMPHGNGGRHGTCIESLWHVASCWAVAGLKRRQLTIPVDWNGLSTYKLIKLQALLSLENCR